MIAFRAIHVRALASLVLVVGLAACSDDTAAPPTTGENNDSGQADAGGDVAVDIPEDTGPGDPPEPGTYGAPCNNDDDCNTRICVPDGDGGICSEFCLTDCDPFYPDRTANCRADADRPGDLAFVCYPAQNLSCAPCAERAQCDGQPCVETVDGLRCASGCTGPGDCGDGEVCRSAIDSGGSEVMVCLRANGSCTCDGSSVGETRACVRENTFGSCIGEEMCDPDQGWVGCNAAEPLQEVCDGQDQNCNGVPDDDINPGDCTIDNEFGSCPGTSICQGDGGETCVGPTPMEEVCDLLDNDCDGVTDEGFTDAEGNYTLLSHCGGCNLSCEGRFSFADSITCDGDRDTPACIVETCADGYQLVGETNCVPLQEVTCQPCTESADCNAISPGAECLTLGDPEQPETLAQVCGRDCSAGGVFGTDCPPDFVCQTFDVNGTSVDQCVPSGGTCLCIDNPQGFAVPCTVVDDTLGLTCQGIRQCVGDEFGDCELPAEVCDGIDNDCDGVIDNGFRDPGTGAYDLDPEHCGRCNNDCGLLVFNNASGTCNTGGAVPVCEMTCDMDFRDLFNGTDDGCECEVLDSDDLPDGQDRNCDRIDGNLALGVFVSKTGTAGGAGTIDDPLDSVQTAVDTVVASAGAKRDVYVSTGVYSENVVLAAGVNVFGGYSIDFLDRDVQDNQTTLLGVVPSGAERATVTAVDITSATTLDGFTIYGRNAAIPGANSYAVFLQNSSGSLALTNNVIVAGAGANGQRGQSGNNGTDGVNGAPGSDAISAGSRNCSVAPTAGGSGGGKSCGATDVSGGDGGEARCPQTQRINGTIPCDHNNQGGNNECRNSCDGAPCSPLPPGQGPGEDGSGPNPGNGGSPTYDRWTDDGVCFLCGLFPALDHRGNPGNNAPDGNNGNRGNGCSNAEGAVDGSGNWSPGSGGNGAHGQHGSGGGGGSAGSGLDTTPGASQGSCIDTLGGSGGGGGSGGCRGTRGTGGTGGGGSFAVMIHYTAVVASAPSLSGNTFVGGAGGNGGNGGGGGVGGAGGLGATGGIAVSEDAFCAEPGGRGGNGGRGGAGGGGGGGCGGLSVGVFLSPGANGFSADAYRGGNTFTLGSGGIGGAGGGSTGNAGTDGSDGAVADVITR